MNGVRRYDGRHRVTAVNRGRYLPYAVCEQMHKVAQRARGQSISSRGAASAPRRRRTPPASPVPGHGRTTTTVRLQAPERQSPGGKSMVAGHEWLYRPGVALAGCASGHALAAKCACGKLRRTLAGTNRTESALCEERPSWDMKRLGFPHQQGETRNYGTRPLSRWHRLGIGDASRNRVVSDLLRSFGISMPLSPQLDPAA